MFIAIWAAGLMSFGAYQIWIGEVAGKGGWIKKSDHPRWFALGIIMWMVVALPPALVVVIDIICRLFGAASARH